MAHPWARGAYLAPPASFSSGLRPALVRCQVTQGPRLRAGFPARGGGGGVGMVWGSASARFLYVRLALAPFCHFLLSHATNDGLHRMPPLSMRTSVPLDGTGAFRGCKAQDRQFSHLVSRRVQCWPNVDPRLTACNFDRRSGLRSISESYKLRGWLSLQHDFQPMLSIFR